MIRSHLRAGIALACAFGLSACGGGDGDVYIGGTVSGNTKAGLVVTNNDGPRLEIAANQQEFFFPDRMETNERYNVKVVAFPDNTTGCTVSRGTGKAVYSISNVAIACTLKTYPLTVRITQAPGTTRSLNLELVNGPDRKVAKPGDTTVEMAPIPEGFAYGITILPENAPNCTVVNGTGTMGTETKVVDVTCS